MTRFQVGETVRTKANPDRAGMVRRVFADGPEPQYEVFFSANERPTFPEHSLLAEDAGPTDDPVEMLRRWKVDGHAQFQSYMTLAKLVNPLATTVYSYLASRTELLEYQFKPVLKLLDSPYSRILIADEVGLGKTIEAGIILSELHARQSMGQVLVTCPSGLTDKWVNELRERFEWEFDIVDGVGLRKALAQSSQSPHLPLRIIASMELMRREENLSALQEHAPRFDLVIVDEAHHMRNQGTMTNQLGEMLSSYAEGMVFLTATPLNLGNEDFFELLSLLVPEEFNSFADFEHQIAPNEHINAALRMVRAADPDYGAARDELLKLQRTSQATRIAGDPRYTEAIRLLETAEQEGGGGRELAVNAQRQLIQLNTLSHVFTRTKKREVARLFPLRRAHWIRVHFNEEEREFYEAVSDWVQKASERYGIGVGAFVTIMFQRQLASCMPAMGEKLEESVLGSAIVYDREEVMEALDPDVLAGDALLEADARLELGEDERDLLARLRSSWRATRGHDSKFDEFRRSLVQLMEGGARKVIVFSFFRKTIEYLDRRLSQVEVNGEPLRVIKLYGPVPPRERHERVDAFRDESSPVVMLSSEVGSEGLDFQFCSAMFNYDLPWNPMRVEQRIGRLDRLGQQAESIDILNLVAEDTVEDRIFARLYERIQIFERSIGDLEAILGSELRDLQRDIAHGALTPEEEDERATLVADVILHRQQDHDEFDEQSRKFLGTDEVFRDRFHDIEEGKRYISAEELRRFVVDFLARRFPRVRLKGAGDPDVFDLTGGNDQGFYQFLGDWFTRDPQGSRRDWQAMSRLSGVDAVSVTFSAASAVRDHALEFLSIHHPLVRAIVAEENAADGRSPTGCFRISPSGSRAGICMFFVFRINVGGMKARIELLPTVVTDTGEVDGHLSESFFVHLAQAAPTDISPADLLTDDRVDKAAAAARAYAASEVVRREEEVERLNNATIDAQAESLRLGYERRRDRLERQLVEARDERIIRLYRGELANRELTFKRKQAELEAKRAVEVSSELIAAGFLEVAEA